MIELHQALKELKSQLAIGRLEVKNLKATNADIILDEQEIEEALYVARQVKRWAMEEAEVERKKQAALNEYNRPWKATDLFQFVQHRAISEYGFSAGLGKDGKPVFEIDKHNMKTFEALSYYFTNDPEFEKMDSEWKLNKGICLFGNVGLGKSLIMNLFSRNKRQCFRMVSCLDIAAEYVNQDKEIGGEQAIEKFSTLFPETFHDKRVFYQRHSGLCLDDLGTEGVKVNFGNRLNVLEKVLLTRYSHKHVYGFENTHVTTNLTEDEIASMYGTRVLSRFREMFNVIPLVGYDRRSGMPEGQQVTSG